MLLKWKELYESKLRDQSFQLCAAYHNENRMKFILGKREAEPSFFYTLVAIMYTHKNNSATGLPLILQPR